MSRHQATYNSWSTMIQRCTNPKATSYPWYGGRGIAICERWRKWSNFLADMGERPDGMSLERKDNNGDYEPGNCVWMLHVNQNRHRRSNQLDADKAQVIRDKAEELQSKRAAARWAEQVGLCTMTAARHVFRGSWA